MHEESTPKQPLKPQELERRKVALESESERERICKEVDVQTSLDRIDQGVLEQVFSDLLQKADSEELLQKFIDVKDFYLDHMPESNAMGLYVPAEICPEGRGLRRGRIKINTARYRDTIQILWTVIHEEFHALTDNYDVLDEDGGRRLGVQKVSVSSSGHTYTGINEGLTELLTARVLAEYLNRTGFSEGDGLSRSSYAEYRDLRYIKGLYSEYMMDVEDYIETLAELSEVPTDHVERALFHTYLTNGEIVPKELVTELQVSPAIVRELDEQFSRKVHRSRDVGTIRDIIAAKE